MPLPMRESFGFGRWLTFTAAGVVTAGCVPDNTFRLVFAENIVQTMTLVSQGSTALVLGLGDTILNAIAATIFSTLLPT